ncbi:MAG TPA: hypothetical protein VE398_15300 [Acidobacteriota bacterium]|nr:hypothetical protein [Acidobacteriota bacterium]
MIRPTHLFLLALPAFSALLFASDEASVRARIRAGVQSIRLIDTHEHLSPDNRVKQEQSLFTLLHYVSSDMWADGMDRGTMERLLADPSVPLEKKSQAIAPYWDNVRTTPTGGIC